jgi:transcriptional regulator with XRE-family HTH domain
MPKKPRRRSEEWLDEPGLAELILRVRASQGWSQRDLADFAGLDGSSIARIESHQRRPTRRTVEAIAKGLGLESEEVLRLARRLSESSDPGAAEEIVRAVASHAAQVDRHSERRQRPDPGPGPTRVARPESTAAPAFFATREFAATAPEGVLRWVFRKEVGRDERGYWINPAARVLERGLDREDVRFTRFDDGTMVIEPGLLAEGVEIGPRDPARHTTRVSVIGTTVPDDDQALSDAYATTVLEIDLPEGSRITVEPRPPGITEGAFPEGVAHVHVITAANPYSRPLTPGENDERNRYLRRDLDAAGLSFTEALGRSPDLDAWQEASFAVFDGEEDGLLELARRHEQAAIFRWTPTERVVVYTDRRRPRAHGWCSKSQA